jgi:hypothetical protein
VYDYFSQHPGMGFAIVIVVPATEKVRKKLAPPATWESKLSSPDASIAGALRDRVARDTGGNRMHHATIVDQSNRGPDRDISHVWDIATVSGHATEGAVPDDHIRIAGHR